MSSRRRQRTELSSAFSESSSPASKRPQAPREDTSGLQAASSAASLLPSDEESLTDKWVKLKNDMWNMPCEIKSDVGKILAENLALRKDVAELKSLQISDTQIASLKQTVDNTAVTLKRYEERLKRSGRFHYPTRGQGL